MRASRQYTFHAGVNHLTGITAVYYVRNPSSSDARVVFQQSLLRAILDKIANEHLLTNPLTAVRVVHALVAMLTVDSNFTNSEVESFATRLESVGGSASTFVTAPTYPGSSGFDLNLPLSNELWAAIGHDSIAAFAKRYPATVTPAAPG